MKFKIAISLILLASCARVQAPDLPLENQIDLKQVSEIGWGVVKMSEPSCGAEYANLLGKPMLADIVLDHVTQQYTLEYSNLALKNGCVDTNNPDCYEVNIGQTIQLSQMDIDRLQAVLNEIPAPDENAVIQTDACIQENMFVFPDTISDGFIYCEGCKAGGPAHAQKVKAAFDFIKSLIP